MDTIENLIIAIVKPLISQPDALTIKIEDTPEFLEYHLDLDPSDVGRVIGRKGRTISAIRTIVYSVPTEDKKAISSTRPRGKRGSSSVTKPKSRF